MLPSCVTNLALHCCRSRCGIASGMIVVIFVLALPWRAATATGWCACPNAGELNCGNALLSDCPRPRGKHVVFNNNGPDLFFLSVQALKPIGFRAMRDRPANLPGHSHAEAARLEATILDALLG
jgi:hypothetical protein